MPGQSVPALLALALGAGMILPQPAVAQNRTGESAPIAAPEQTSSAAEAYYQFMLGRYLEGAGEIEDAIAAYRQATALHPESAEILSELASLYARQNQPHDAIAAGEAALQLDPDHAGVHRVLGLVYAALTQAELAGSDDATTVSAKDHAARAIDHLEQAQRGQAFDASVQLALGRLFLALADPASAVTAFEQVVFSDQATLESALLLSRAYRAAGRRVDAIRALEAVVQREPRFYRALIDLARLYEQEQRWREAADAYAGAAVQNPDSTELVARRANALLNAGDPAEAAVLLRPLQTSAPNDGAVLYLLSQAERQLNEFDAAEAAARRLVALEPGEFRGVYALVQVFERRRDHRQIIEVLEPAIRAARRSDVPAGQLARLLSQLGFAYSDTQQHDRAISTLRQASRLLPGDVSLASSLVYAHVAAGRFSTAVDLARDARRRHPDDLRLARLEAQALRGVGRRDRSVSVIEQMFTGRESDPVAHLALAEAYAGAERTDDALRVLRTAGEQFPDDAAVRYEMGALLQRQNRHEEAEAVLRELLDRDPRHAPALNLLGYMLADRGLRLEESVELIQSALALDPYNGSYIDSLGWAYYRLNRLDLAERYLRQAAEQLPANSVVQDHFGDVLLQLGRYDEAVAAWERALAGHDDSVDRARIQRKIRDTRDRARQR